MVKPLKSVKVYILLGYITLILIAAVTVWAVYNETIKLYDNQVNINPVSDKIFLANSIITDLYEAESLKRSYLQTGNPEHYQAYNVLIDTISSQIDLLGSIESYPSQLMHTDSIQILLEKKRENLNELILLKNSASSEKLYERALVKLTQNKDSLNQLINNYAAANSGKDSVYTRHKKARFFERLINVFAPPAVSDSSLETSVNNPDQEDRVLIAFNPADSIEQIMTSIIDEIRKESVAFEKLLMQKEQENLENAQTITLQIRQILSNFENEEILYSLRKVSVQQVHIARMTDIVIILGAVALLIIVGFLTLILKDITRSQHYRQKLEKEKSYSESLLKSKEQLMLSITHDLKSPLNSIAGFANLASKNNDPEHQIRYLKNIENSANFISRLIKDLLDFARLETGKMTIESHSVNLKILMEEVISGFFPLAKEKNLRLELSADKISGNIYLTDGARINQILSNLVSNAIKFTHEGFIKVIVSTKKIKGKIEWIQIEVADSGIGISEENSKLIFEEFSRISTIDNKQYEGTGLGLAITKRIVELLNGTISFSGSVGKGSRFTVVVPLQKLPGETITKVVPQTNGQKVLCNHEKVLLVDDDSFLLELTAHILNEANLRVVSFQKAHEALNAINGQSFDLLITDVQMPGLNGFELLAHFREKNPTHIPAIALTGESNDQSHYLAAGFFAVIQKPFQPDDLIKVITASLNSKTNGSSVSLKYSIEGIKAFSEGEIETTREILISLTHSTSQNLHMFRQYLKTENFKEIKNLAHKMLPMFRQLEAVDIIEPLQMLEQTSYYGKEDEWLEICYPLLIQIENLMEKIIEKYQLPFSGKLIS